MATFTIRDLGHSRCCSEVPGFASPIITDVSAASQGLAEHPSPTDLLVVALGSCMLSVLTITARREGIMLGPVSLTVKKEMLATPMRFRSLQVVFAMPGGIPLEARRRLERAVLGCPVHHALHPDIEFGVLYEYPDPDAPAPGAS